MYRCITVLSVKCVVKGERFKAQGPRSVGLFHNAHGILCELGVLCGQEIRKLGYQDAF
jgi:hypothetical protein